MLVFQRKYTLSGPPSPKIGSRKCLSVWIVVLALFKLCGPKLSAETTEPALFYFAHNLFFWLFKIKFGLKDIKLILQHPFFHKRLIFFLQKLVSGLFLDFNVNVVWGANYHITFNLHNTMENGSGIWVGAVLIKGGVSTPSLSSGAELQPLD